MPYILGLDLGIASIGWALIQVQPKDKDKKTEESLCALLDCGVRIFKKAEVPKSGASLAAERRQKNGRKRTFVLETQYCRSKATGIMHIKKACVSTQAF